MNKKAPYSRYTELLEELHQLIKNDEDDDRGDELRDEMDLYWEQLTENERQRAMALSEDLFASQHEVAEVHRKRHAH